MAKILGEYIDSMGRRMVKMDMEDGAQPLDVPADAAGIPPQVSAPAPTMFDAVPNMGADPSAGATQSQPQPAWRAEAKKEVDNEAAEAKAQEAAILETPLIDRVIQRPKPVSEPQPAALPQSTEILTESVRLSPRLQLERENAQKQMLLAQAQTSKALDAELDAAKEDARQRKDFLDTETALEQKRQADTEAAKQAQLDKYQAAADQFAGTKIDSGRYWRNASTGDKILAGIGLLAGAWSTMQDPNAKNYGLEYINNVIERDIREQEANLRTAEKTADMQQTLYQMLRSQGLDRESAAAKMREMAYQSLNTKLTGMAADSKNESAKAALSMQAANFQQQAVNEAAKYENTVTRTATKDLQLKPAKELDSTTIEKLGTAQAGLQKIYDTEDAITKLAKSSKVGGRYNAVEAEVKDFLGIQKDMDIQDAWKGYETILMQERAKVFGASLTESERKSFQQAITTWHSRPEMLVNAIKQIRENTEREYKAKADLFKSQKYDVSGLDIPLRIDQDKDKKKFTSAPR